MTALTDKRMSALTVCGGVASSGTGENGIA